MIIACLIGFYLLSGCTSNENKQFNNEPSQKIFNDAQAALDNNNYVVAISLYEQLQSQYPFSIHKIQAELNLIYSYYRTNQYPEALSYINKFIRLNPNHPDLDYLYYMKGVISMHMQGNDLHEFFNIERYDRDNHYLKEAFNAFDYLLLEYKNSKYVYDARLRMIWIKNQLARYEMQVADYYFKIQAWVAALDRANEVFLAYTGSSATQAALEMMYLCYVNLSQKKLAEDTLKVIKASFPQSYLAKTP